MQRIQLDPTTQKLSAVTVVCGGLTRFTVSVTFRKNVDCELNGDRARFEVEHRTRKKEEVTIITSIELVPADIDQGDLVELAEKTVDAIESAFRLTAAERVEVRQKFGHGSPQHDYLLSRKERVGIMQTQTLWLDGTLFKPFSAARKSYGILVWPGNGEISQEMRGDIAAYFDMKPGWLKESRSMPQVYGCKECAEGATMAIYATDNAVKEPPMLKLGDTVWCVSKREIQQTKKLNIYVADKTIRVIELLGDGTIIYGAGKWKELWFRYDAKAGCFMSCPAPDAEDASTFTKPVYTSQAQAEEQAQKGEY